MSHTNGFIGRRDFFKQIGLGGFAIAMASTQWLLEPVQAAELNSTPSHVLTPNAALDQLLQGNQRFQAHHPRHPHESSARLQEVTQVQHPFATILGCADSRVPVELLFDQGIGDLFDIRVAGNIVTPEVLGSLEYAAVMLACPLIMVLGHERCGAVTAAVKGEPLPGEMGSFVKAIAPSLTSIPEAMTTGATGGTETGTRDRVEQAVIANIRYQVKQVLQRSDLIAQRVEGKTLKIVGGRYDLDTGKVTLI